MELHYIDLNSQYRLYAFATYQDMAAAREQLKHVVLAKAFEKVREIEAKNFMRRITQGGGFQNYLEINTANPKRTALASLVTALQALYKDNGYSAKFIIVEGI